MFTICVTNNELSSRPQLQQPQQPSSASDTPRIRAAGREHHLSAAAAVASASAADGQRSHVRSGGIRPLITRCLKERETATESPAHASSSSSSSSQVGYLRIALAR